MWMYIKSEKKRRNTKKKIEKLLMGCVLLIFVYVHSQRHLLSPSHFSLRFVCIYIALFFLQHLIGIPEGDEEEIERMQKRNSSPPAAGASHFSGKIYIIYLRNREKKTMSILFFFFAIPKSSPSLCPPIIACMSLL